MSKFSILLRSNKLLFISFGLSIIVVIVGIFMLAITPAQSPDLSLNKAQQETNQTFVNELNEGKDLILNSMKSSDDQNHSYKNTSPARGSEEWCEAMMIKKESDWNEADTQLFGQKCL